MTARSHLESASGVLAVVKAIMMIERGVILPTALFESMNPKIEGHEKLKVRGGHYDLRTHTNDDVGTDKRNTVAV